MKTKKILVTGGTGYIGSHTVVKLHQAGYFPVVIDNFANSHPFMADRLKELAPTVSFYEGGIEEVALLEEICKKEHLEGVIHFAAHKSVHEATQNPLRYYENNVANMVSMLKVLVRYTHCKHFIFSSTCTVYGKTCTLPLTESQPLSETASPYSYTKQIGEQLIQDLIRAYPHLNAVLLRYFNPIGSDSSLRIGELPSSPPANLVAVMVDMLHRQKEKACLQVYGDDYPTADGTCLRDYIDVMDLATAHIDALGWLAHQENICETLNCGTGKGSSVKEIIRTFEEVNNLTMPYKCVARREGDLPVLYADTAKIEKTLDWKPQHTLQESLKNAWRWRISCP